MPHYQIHHSTPLTTAQQSSLATSITNIHCTLFSAPSLFVNITFHSTSSTPTYVGGVSCQTNYIHAHIRPRGERYRWKLTELVQNIMKAWTDNISDDVNKKEDWQQGRLDDDEALHNIFVMEDIIAGAEQGFMLPVAGQDGNWLREHEEKFMKRAESGDESMKRLLGEMEVMEVNGRKK